MTAVPLEPMVCDHDGVALHGFVSVPEGKGPHPAVLVMHSGLGIGHLSEETVRRLAGLGYLAVASNMYGPDADLSTPGKTGATCAALMQEPAVLRDRCVRWFDAVATRDDVDSSRIAAIGYCLGGKCVLELARSGRDVKAAVSFHGDLTTHAPASPGAIRGEVVALCGARDPFCTPDTTVAFRAEMEAAAASWQITEWGKVAHGFTDAEGSGMAPGLEYDAIADKVSWAGTLALLDQVLRRT